MGMAFSLVGLLIVMLIMAMLYANSSQTDIKAGQQAQQQIQQIAGRDQSGAPVTDTYAVTPEMRTDGRVKDLLVSRLNPDSPMAGFFGLQQGDQIIAAVHDGVEWDFNQSTDSGDAKIHVEEAYQKGSVGGQLIVMRNGQKLTLPQGHQNGTGSPDLTGPLHSLGGS
jgi:hypothetical protein